MRRVKTGGAVLAGGFFSRWRAPAVRHRERAGAAERSVERVLTGNYYFPITERFGTDGHAEDVDKYFNANLNSNVFPSCRRWTTLFLGSAGHRDHRDQRGVVSVRGHGVEAFHPVWSHRPLHRGILVPYQWLKTNVKQVNLNTANATVGTNPDWRTGSFGGVPLIPIAAAAFP